MKTEVISPDTFSRRPPPVAMVSTETVHVAPAATEASPPNKGPYVKVLLPGVADKVPPVQVVDALAGSAMTSPVGRESLNERLKANEPLAELSILKVSVLRAPLWTTEGEKLLEKPGRLVATVRSATAGPLLPKLEVRSPEMFVWVPTTLDVTRTRTEQLAKAPSCPPV
jgi:hypothetical protein